jgi:hypothetical protein
MNEKDAALFIPDLVRVFETLRRVTAADTTGGRVHEAIEALAREHSFEPSTAWDLWNALLDDCEALARGTATGGDRDSDARHLGRRLASRGWNLADSLSALLSLRQLMMETVRAIAQAEGHGHGLIRIGMLQMSRAMSQFMVGFNQGHLESELAERARSRVEHDVFVWRSLTGTSPSGDDFTRLGAFGFDSAVKYHAFRARVDGEQDREWLEDVFALTHAADRRLGMAMALDGEVCGFVSRLPNVSESRFPIGVSEAVIFTQLPNAFRKASRALHVARRTGRTGVHSLESLGLVTAVASDSDVAAVVTEKYLSPLQQLGEYGDTLIDTVRQYVAAACQLDSAASSLGLHNNTVRYRVAKFEQILGVSLRETSVLTELWWAFNVPERRTQEPESLDAAALREAEGSVNA